MNNYFDTCIGNQTTPLSIITAGPRETALIIYPCSLKESQERFESLKNKKTEISKDPQKKKNKPVIFLRRKATMNLIDSKGVRRHIATGNEISKLVILKPFQSIIFR